MQTWRTSTEPAFSDALQHFGEMAARIFYSYVAAF